MGRQIGRKSDRIRNKQNIRSGALKTKNLSLAYESGKYFCLVLALSYEELGRPDVGVQLWHFLTSMRPPYISTKELLVKIKFLSFDKIDLDEMLVPNPGFRYGMPGKYYSAAIGDFLDFCVFEKYKQLKAEKPVVVHKLYSDWITNQMQQVKNTMMIVMEEL